MTKKPRTHMTKEEKEKWDELYEYVRSKVMGYDENVCLSSNMALRLKGMLNGKFMANKCHKDKANYSYDVVLAAFKYSMPEIQRAINRVSFVDEQHKFNYLMRIVDNNLSTVYLRMKRAEKVKEEAEKADISYAAEYVNTFKSKKTNSNKNLDELW